MWKGRVPAGSVLPEIQGTMWETRYNRRGYHRWFWRWFTVCFSKSQFQDQDWCFNYSETPDEFEEHQSQRIEKKGEEAEEAKPEAQGVGTDEVTAYCTNYVENYNFYCVGDMSPEHEKFCNSYKKNCPDRVSWVSADGYVFFFEFNLFFLFELFCYLFVYKELSRLFLILSYTFGFFLLWMYLKTRLHGFCSCLIFYWEGMIKTCSVYKAPLVLF